MKRKNTLYIPIVFLSFLILFGSFYLIVEKDYLLAAVLGSISIVTLIIVYNLLKKENIQEIDDPLDFHDSKFYVKDANIDEEIIEEERIVAVKKNDDLSSKSQETLERAYEEKKSIKFKVIVNDNFEENILSFIADMIEEDMFLESLEYRYTKEEIIKYKLQASNLYKYEFHPIPLVALIKDFRNENIIKLMLGINSKKMVHVGYVPQSHIDEVKEHYNQINNVKASLSGGNYKILSKNGNHISEYIDPFIIDVSIYL